jgi:cytoskeletal protein CcmA (bactofilin family)
MSCPGEIVLSIYADGELPSEEAARVRTHVESCSDCGALLRALQRENAVLMDVLAEEVLEQDAVPAASRWSWRSGALGAAVLSPLVYWAWQELLNLPPGLGWLVERDGLGGLLGVSRGVLRFLAGGQDPGTQLFGSLATVLAVFAVLGILALRRHLQFRTGAAVALPLLVGLALTSPARAAEIRSAEGGTVEIAAGELIEDNVFLSGESAIVAGVVEGDVFAAADRVEVTGEVRGNVYCAAEAVKITARVTGNVFALGGNLSVNSKVGGSLFLAGANVLLGKDGDLARDAYLVGESLRIEGRLRRGLYFAVEQAHIAGSVARSIRGYAGRFTLDSSGSVGGDLAVTVPTQDAFRVEPGAKVGGATQIEVDPGHAERDFLHVGFYLAVLAKALALLLLGLCGVTLFPRLLPGPPQSSVEAFRNMGIGLGVLVLVPFATLVIALTVVGIPIAIVLATTYAVLFYASTLVVAYFAGLRLPAAGHSRLVLRTGLSLVAILLLVELPLVGHGLNVMVHVFGMGYAAVHLKEQYAARRPGATGYSHG